jgi:hypothetical protein
MWLEDKPELACISGVIERDSNPCVMSDLDINDGRSKIRFSLYMETEDEAQKAIKQAESLRTFINEFTDRLKQAIGYTDFTTKEEN